MAEFKDLTSKFLVSGILLISLFSFLIIFQSQNNAPNPLIEYNLFNESFKSLNLTIVDSTAVAEQKYGVFNSEEPRPGIGSIVLFGIVSVGKSFSGIIFGFFRAIIKLPFVMLGIDQTYYNLILMYLIITIIVAVWLLYKLGG